MFLHASLQKIYDLYGGDWWFTFVLFLGFISFQTGPPTYKSDVHRLSVFSQCTLKDE